MRITAISEKNLHVCSSLVFRIQFERRWIGGIVFAREKHERPLITYPPFCRFPRLNKENKSTSIAPRKSPPQCTVLPHSGSSHDVHPACFCEFAVTVLRGQCRFVVSTPVASVECGFGSRVHLEKCGKSLECRELLYLLRYWERKLAVAPCSLQHVNLHEWWVSGAFW